DGECRECLLKVGWPKQALVPGERRIEVVHQVLREDVGVARREGVERLRRKRIKYRVDRVRPRGLHTGVSLQSKPSRIFLVDVVVDTDRLHLLVVVAGVRDALLVGATIPGSAKWTAKYRDGCAAGISIEIEHPLIERAIQLFATIGDLSPRKLPQDVLLETQTGNDRRRDDRQRDPHPFAVKEKEQLVVHNRAAHTAPKMIHRRSGFVTPWYRIGE